MEVLYNAKKNFKKANTTEKLTGEFFD